MRRLVFVVIGLGLVAVVVIGLTQGRGHDAASARTALSPAQQRARLAGSPPALARLHDQAGRLLPATPQTVHRRLAALRGHPVVVNGWASWCNPCRLEFPFLQRAAVDFGRRVAFVGIDSADNAGDAGAFLRRFPVAYPSYQDPSAHIGHALHAPNGLPYTIFYDARGRMAFLHQGAYPSAATLEADIRRYALDDAA